MYLKGVGPKRAEALAAVKVETLEDMLEYFPRRYLDRSKVTTIGQLQADVEVTIVGEVVSKQLIRYGKRRLVLKISDGTGIMEAVWFAQPGLFEKIFKAEQMVAFSGKPKRYKQWQMVHPDFDVLTETREPLNTGQLIPIYPSTQDLKKNGVGNYTFRRIIFQALQKYGSEIPESLPPSLCKRYKLMSRRDAYQQMHFPESDAALQQVLRRFKYEEIFYLQLLIALRKHFYYAPLAALPVTIDDQLVAQFLDSLPFQLTGAQQRVVDEIRADLQGGAPMNRLVQGDVGAGKTIVALIAMLMVVSSGYQAALMAPTEILARQHYQNIQALLEGLPIRVTVLLGGQKASEKKRIQQEIADGQWDLVVGTHALIQDKVQFPKLGLAIVDEQHRFGVLQRGELIEKGETPHVLVMTATPIPRTLALTIYGDLDVSVIDELPPGRQAIRTFWRTRDKLPQIYDFVRQHLQAGKQVYVVYPLVEESEKLDLQAATEAYQDLSANVFPDYTLGLLHGRMKADEKENVMAAFKRGDCHMLISTTVIEVGVDVPNATIMIIEHAERFGLSQLHQLRGRVGRGGSQSYCILVTPEKVSDVAGQRMQIMQKTNDGFVIAEEDLRLRGSGDFFGTRQHGMPDLKYADLAVDYKIVQVAHNDAFELVEKDPHLRKAENQTLRIQFKRRFADKFRMPDIA